jgi:hypothetical protein
MRHWLRAAVLLLPLALAACLFTPGKFDSTLTVRKDRSFTFTYKGEVMAIDLKGLGEGMGDMKVTPHEDGDEAKTEDGDTPEKTPAETAAEEARKKAEKDAEYRELATQLAKEAGYRSVEYRGNGLFYVDYALSGTLTHNFIYPFNQDAAMIFPWVAIELRGRDGIRVKAPGFAKQDTSQAGMGMPLGDQGESKMEGTFTLTTDAQIVSQNNEEGGETVGSNTVITWKVTPRTDTPPMAVLKVVGI